MITAENLTIGYLPNKRRNKIVHRNLCFSLETGELTCLLGANGTGKSTLLKTISGLLPPLAGSLTIDGRDLSSFTTHELAKIFALVLTDKTMAGGLKVIDMVSMGRYPHTGFFGRLNSGDHEIVENAMSMVGISDKAYSYVSELSDGARQKVMIAKALAQECPVMILDEPTAYLDITGRIELMNLLHSLANKQNKTVLISTHDVEQALMLGDRLWLLSDENSLQSGSTEDMVLSGGMDNFFAIGSIKFDRSNGSFRPQYFYSQKAFVEAPEDLMFWTKNMLIRNGYTTTLNKSEASIDVKIISPTEIFADGTLLTSFADLKHKLENR
ncbi:MAG: ABC transporter ATP-binding protein [Culturomica sp.]|nr:ABC transporter ATP-binding protein [Culturomica sp.]